MTGPPAGLAPRATTPVVHRDARSTSTTSLVGRWPIAGESLLYLAVALAGLGELVHRAR